MTFIAFSAFTRRQRNHLVARCVSLLMFLSLPAWALSPEIETDRLLLAAEERITQQDYAGALQFLTRVPALNVAPPVQYFYFDGKAHYETGSKLEAKTYLERYVEKAGREGDYYQDALTMLTAIEQADVAAVKQQEQKVMRQASEETAVSSSSGEQRHGEEYDSKVQKLYLGIPLKEALVTHINGLLRTYAYLDGKVKNADRNERLQYSLSLRGRDEMLVTETRRMMTSHGPQNQINVLPLNAFGVSPFVDFRCSKAADSCYLKSPADATDWIRVAYDPAGARELSLAFERLLKAVQRG